jgi:hypothetical protein
MSHPLPPKEKFWSLFECISSLLIQCFSSKQIFATWQERKGGCKRYKWFFVFGKKAPKSPHYEENGSKSPFLDNRFQQAAKLYEVSNFILFSFLSPSDL